MISFLSVLLLLGVVIGFVSYTNVKTDFDKQMVGYAKQNVKILDDILNQMLDAKSNDLEFLSQMLQGKVSDKESGKKVQEEFVKYMKIHEEVEDIYSSSNQKLFSIGVPDKDGKGGLDETYEYRDRPWFKEANEKKGQVIITKPYKSTSGNVVVTVAKQTKDGSGVIGIDLSLKSLEKTVKMITIGEKGYAFILGTNEETVIHPTRGTGSKLDFPWIKDVYKKKEDVFSYSDGDVEKQMAYRTNDKTGWKIGGVIMYEEILDSAADVFFKIMVVVTIAIVLSAIGIFFVTKTITTPLKRLVDSAKKVSEGDLTEKVEITTNDELGQLGTSFNAMSESLRDVIAQIHSSANHVTVASNELTTGVKQVNSATEQITLSMEQVSQAAEIQTRDVEQGANLIQEVSVGVQDIVSRSSVISESSNYTKEKAENGGELVEKTVEQMNSIRNSVGNSDVLIRKLNEKSKQISDIVEVIKGIANQTNLLALNAGIEAARAGEHGKGFAIVADEVKKLAEESALSSNEITKLIFEIQRDMEDTVSAMKHVNTEVDSGIEITNQTKQSFEEILDATDGIGTQMSQMVATVSQIADAIEDVEKFVNNTAATAKENEASTQNIAASSEEQLASMEQIGSSADMLSRMSEELQKMVKKFKV